MDIHAWQLLVALAALLGPALVIVGVVVGRVQEKVRAAHVRIDKLEARHESDESDYSARWRAHEETRRKEFQQLRDDVQGYIREAWRYCPVAADRAVTVPKPGSGGGGEI